MIGQNAANATGDAVPRDAREERSFLESLEAFRGVAAILIVVFHAYQYSREGAGVEQYLYEGTALHFLFNNLRLTEWFFVLTGFLLFLPVARAALTQRVPRGISEYPVRWAFRVLPLYYFAIIVVWTWRYFGTSEQRQDLLYHLTFTQVFSREHIFWTIGPAWTLALEVIFFLFVVVFGPLVYLACGRLRAARLRAALLTGTVGALILFGVAYKAWARYLADVPEDNFPVYFGPLASLDTFAMGMLLAVAAAYGRPRLGANASSLLTLGGVVLAVSAFFLSGYGAVSLYVHTLSGAAFLMVLAPVILGPRDRSLKKIVDRPGARYLGVISYGIFLWHEPLMIEFGKRGFLISSSPDAFPQNALVLVALSIIVAALSERLLERPALFLRHLFDHGGRRKGRLSPRRPEW